MAQRTLPASLLTASWSRTAAQAGQPAGEQAAEPAGETAVEVAGETSGEDEVSVVQPAADANQLLERQLTGDEVKKVWLPLLRLRQACCHPQVRIGSAGSRSNV